MQNTDKHINLIIKHLSGETSENEEQNLQIWLSEDEKNRRLYDDYKKIWSLSQKEHIQEIENINIDGEWQKFKQKVNFDNEKYSIKTEKKTFSFIRIAASILILISVGIAGIYLFGGKEQKIVAFNEVKEAKLPDNTEISINKNSEIIYDKNFNKKERKVELKGEAFFKVAKNKEKLFIVKTESFYVEVLGTQFYVNSDYKNRQVVVKEGTVAVYQYKDKRDEIVLHAGDKAVFNKKENKILKIENTDNNYLAWKTKIFNFRNERLDNIFITLANAYNVHFEFVNPDLRKCRQTASFKNQSIDEILNVLEATFENLQFRKNGNIIYVDGKKCN
ncbi:MAG: FecR domain-containing protein [Bacteroidales bacterium]|nr:FecR domain-containing protein [Bacteroidales bacterium]